jgi:hypothetical protein
MVKRNIGPSLSAYPTHTLMDQQPATVPSIMRTPVREKFRLSIQKA